MTLSYCPPEVPDEGRESLEPGVLGVAPSNLYKRVERDTCLIGNGFPALLAVRLKALDHKSKVIHAPTMDHLRSNCKPLDQIWAAKIGPMIIMSKPKPTSPVETGEFAAQSIKSVLAENFKTLCKAHFPDINDEGLVSKLGIPKGTIGRIRRGDVAATLTSLAKIAKAFRLEPYQLLLPISDPHNPLSVRSTNPKPVDDDLAATWHLLSAETRNRFVREALQEAMPGLAEASELLQRLKARLKSTTD